MTAITGHRGARNLWAENSLTGFRKAAALGCDAIEFDVHLTDAGELVVIHDPTLDRTTEATGEVRALTPDARRATRLKDSDDVVPTLDEVLDVLAPVDGLGLHVEIKLDAAGKPYPGIVGRVTETLKARGLGPRCHLTSFDTGLLEECRVAAPDIARLVSANAEWLERQGGLASFIDTVRDLVDIVALHHGVLADHFDEACRLWPLERICVWTVNDEDGMKDWIARGVGHLTSDSPDIALACRAKAA